MKKYQETTIKPASGGFGMYESNQDSSELWDNEYDLEQAMYEGSRNELYELGVDDLPEGIEDIRGNIYNQPSRIFGYLQDGTAYYCGIIEIEKEQRTCRNCQNWNDASAECCVAEKAIANKWDIPEDVEKALGLFSQDELNECDHFVML